MEHLILHIGWRQKTQALRDGMCCVAEIWELPRSRKGAISQTEAYAKDEWGMSETRGWAWERQRSWESAGRFSWRGGLSLELVKRNVGMCGFQGRRALCATPGDGNPLQVRRSCLVQGCWKALPGSSSHLCLESSPDDVLYPQSVSHRPSPVSVNISFWLWDLQILQICPHIACWPIHQVVVYFRGLGLSTCP